VSTPDLLIDVPQGRWLPVVVDLNAWRPSAPIFNRDRLVVAHAPSKGAMKGSDLIDPTLRSLEAQGLLTYRRVDGVPPDQMPTVYGDADIVLDQFGIGSYGVAACEAMAAGRLVVGHVTEQVRGHIRAVTGLDVPIVQARSVELEAVLRDILDDPEKYRGTAAAGRAFVEAVHDGRRSAEILAEFLRPTRAVPKRAA
jgi:glycosyltransferase involved in cell wall biosynthesis